MTRRIRFNAFDMNCVAHQSPGLWRHPEDQSHRYKELGYIVRHVVPVLTARGAYAEEYVPGTLRNALFGAGDRLPPEHRGASYRLGGSGSTALPEAISRPGATAEAHS
nr:hypothetical protein [Nocardia abscessus]